MTTGINTTTYNRPGFTCDGYNAYGEMCEELFYDRYEPMPNPDGSNLWQEAEIGYVPEQRLWSLTHSDTGHLYATPGFSVFNVVGYMVTRQPWLEPDVVAALPGIHD